MANTTKFDNALRRQVYSLPELLRQQYDDLEPKTRKALTTPEIFSIQRIVLTGCGDSYAAAMATKHAFEMLTGIPTEVVTAIELARFYDRKQLGFSPNNPLVIAVSNSGGVARVYEAMERANKHGAFTLGITGNETSRLGACAHKILKLDIPPFESAPGARTYLVSVLSLLLLAIRFGEVRGSYTMDQAMDYRRDLVRQADELQALLPDMDAAVCEIAGKWQHLPAFDFVGAGFDYAAAWYGHAKVFEAVGKYAMHINSEEWLHMNFFMKDTDNLATVIVANTTNPAYSRTKELIGYAGKLGRPLLVVTDGGAGEFDGEVPLVRVPRTAYPISMPLTQFAPLALLAGYIGDMNGEEDGRGCRGKWAFAEGGASVKNSEIIIN